MNQKIFKHKALEKIGNESLQKLSQHKQLLDDISHDIKVIEEQLRSSGAPAGFRFCCEKKYEIDLKQGLSEYDYDEVYNRIYIGDFEELAHFLSWSRDSHSNLRLLFEVCKQQFAIYQPNMSDHSEAYLETSGSPESIEVQSKPLIEWDSSKRIKAFNFIPEFYSRLVANLSEGSFIESEVFAKVLEGFPSPQVALRDEMAPTVEPLPF